MKYTRREYLRQKIKTKMLDTERGQVSWVFGLFLLLFLSILLCMQLQIALYRESAMYMEDALALSGLASAVIDVEEYGITQKVRITDPEGAYERYCHALKENLGLDDMFYAGNRKLISGQVTIQQYILYNVAGERVEVWQKDADGQIQEWEGTLGEVKAPDGQYIEHTGVYSEITYFVEGFMGTDMEAHKGKLVDVVRENDRERKDEFTEAE